MRKIATVLVLLLTCGLTFAQQRTVTGKVTSEDGSPLAGATVSAKGENASTTTDASGRFSISVGTKVKSLIFSYVGVATTEVNITSGEMNVSLKNQSAEISEVIVTGVAGATSKKKMTVSVTKINAEAISKVPATSAASALAGKVAGTRVQSTGGSPGGAIDVLLRGDNNLNVGSSPLIMLDGMILNG